MLTFCAFKQDSVKCRVLTTVFISFKLTSFNYSFYFILEIRVESHLLICQKYFQNVKAIFCLSYFHSTLFRGQYQTVIS